jgi:outer membrane protein OmpA-like peptidoglycan-associated protein
MQRITIASNRIVLFLLASVVAFGAGGDKTQTKGMIMSRTGETLIVSSPEGKVTVVLTDNTRTKDDKGLFGLDKQELSSVVLIPGLKVDVDGVADDQGRVVAKTITVDGDDLETSEMIQSGLHPTAQQVAANVRTLEDHQQGIAANQQGVAANKEQLVAHKENIETNQQNIGAHTQKIEQNIKDIQENTDRFIALSEYDVKGQATVKFPVGRSTISPEDQEQIKQLAQTATGLTGYIVEVMGYTDTTGSAEMNTKLSEDRAKAVITYLVQQGNVPVRHIVAPGAMGEYGPAASNETKAGRAENRRVDVKVLVNKGIAGS